MKKLLIVVVLLFFVAVFLGTVVTLVLIPGTLIRSSAGRWSYRPERAETFECS